MFKIKKITSNPTVDFAAEELKKYLRMMMPRCGEIEIAYEPSANEGFRLGLMSDFGIDTTESQAPMLDDILHIDCDGCGGIIAGSNVRSILLSVYKYLNLNGCRWLFPGIDGERIPINDVKPTYYHKMADCRFRGQCNEGAEAQYLMMDAIDFTPKIGLNTFMLEFDIPTWYYSAYYTHLENTANREPEPVTPDQVLMWKRQCEAEITKRGLLFHDMGHGWTATAFDIDTSEGCWSRVDEDAVPDENRKYLAMFNGKRALFDARPLNTNFCMSNPEARRIVAKSVADYASLASNVDYLHVWLSDSYNNTCECEECIKKLPSDYYVMLMNDIDEILTERGLKTRIVFICYYDTVWAPETERLNNPDRFALLLAAITRDYGEAVCPHIDESKIKLTKYVLNNNVMPTSVNNYLLHAKEWRESCKVPNFIYEYHFWWPQYRDFGLFGMADIVHRDVKGYFANGCSGIVEDCSQRSFFPNGFLFTVYAETLFDTGASLDEMREDYFKAAYGDGYKTVIEMFEKLGETVDFHYFVGSLSKDVKMGKLYNPEMAESLKRIPVIVDEYLPFVNAHKIAPYRAEAVSYRVLSRYLDFIKRLAPILALKAVDKEKEALEQYEEYIRYVGQFEMEMEHNYDHDAMIQSYNRIFRNVRELFNNAD